MVRSLHLASQDAAARARDQAARRPRPDHDRLIVVHRTFDELDLNGTVHNSRFAVHVERAQSALFERLGKGWTRLAERDPDLPYVVRELLLEYLAPLKSLSAIRKELTAGRLGQTSATYDFLCTDPAGNRAIGRGHRVIVKIDETGKPAPWSPWYRDTFQALAEGWLPTAEDVSSDY
jgi:acyl-CoA thioester hydrolase